MTSTRTNRPDGQPVEGRPTPRVSIGLPVHNGERFIREAIESVLCQDFEDFELIISDNASTDGTQSICLELMDRDPRIRYHRTEVNLGAAWNFNHCVHLARGPYFKWMAHDDAYEASYLSSCVAALDQSPEIVLCQSRAIDIDEVGDRLREWDVPGAGTHTDEIVRFRRFVRGRSRYFEAFGVTRRDVLMKTSLIGSYTGSDVVLLAQLATYGPFGEVPEMLYLHREHPNRSVRRYAERTRRVWFATGRDQRIPLPTWRLGYELLKVAGGSPNRLPARGALVREVLGWAWHFRRRLVREALKATIEVWRLLPALEGPRSSVGRCSDSLAAEAESSIHSCSHVDATRCRRIPSLVSVILASSNDASTLGAQLEALSRQDYVGAWEVVVVDRGSFDDSAILAAGWRTRLSRLRLLEEERTCGLADAWDRGAHAASGDLLLYALPEQIVEQDWISALVAAAAGADVVGGRSLVEDHRQRTIDLAFDDWRTEPGLLAAGTLGIWKDALSSIGGWGDAAGLGGSVTSGRSPEQLTWELCWLARSRGRAIAFTGAVSARRTMPFLPVFLGQQYGLGRVRRGLEARTPQSPPGREGLVEAARSEPRSDGRRALDSSVVAPLVARRAVLLARGFGQAIGGHR